MNREVNTLGVLKPEVKARALRLWLSGLTYRAINEKTGVSLDAMNELVNEARKKMPDIDDLRHLNMILQKSGVTLVDAMRACSILPRLDELGIGINELSGLITEETAKEVLRLEGEKVRLEGELKSVEGKRSLAEKDLKIY